MWCLFVLIHEVLECHIPCFLEPHVVFESSLDDIINFCFELEESHGEFIWVLLIVFVFDNFSSLTHDERSHLVNNVLESSFNP